MPLNFWTMPKQKTVKAFSKRIKVTKNGKMVIRHAGQGHFNTRADGNKTRKKRRDHELSESKRKTVNRAMPHA